MARLILLFGITVSSLSPLSGGNVSGDVLHIPLPASEVSLDPTAIQDQSSLLVSRQINCQLVRMRQGKVEPEAIESYRFLSPTEIEMVLGTRFTFHDGSQIQAEDVIATFESLRKSRSVLRNIFDWVKNVEAVAPNRVVFRLTREVPHFLKALSAPNQAVMKKGFLEKAAREPALWKKPLGCGRYQVTESNGTTINISPTRPGPLPIVFHLRGGKSITATELESFDLVGFSLAPAGAALPSKFRAEKSFDPYHLFLGLNYQLPQWKDRETRCRYFASLDRGPVFDQYGADAEPAKDLVPRGVIGYLPKVDYPAALKKDHGQFQPRQQVECLTFLSVSVPENRRAGYEKMVKADGHPLTVKVIEQPKHFGPQFQKLKCDAMVLGLKSNYLDAYEYILLFSENDANFTGYHNEDLKHHIKMSQNEEDSTKKAEIYQSILGKIRDACLIYPVATLPMRSTWVKQGRQTPGLGQVSLNEYYLGDIR